MGSWAFQTEQRRMSYVQLSAVPPYLARCLCCRISLACIYAGGHRRPFLHLPSHISTAFTSPPLHPLHPDPNTNLSKPDTGSCALFGRPLSPLIVHTLYLLRTSVPNLVSAGTISDSGGHRIRPRLHRLSLAGCRSRIHHRTPARSVAPYDGHAIGRADSSLRALSWSMALGGIGACKRSEFPSY